MAGTASDGKDLIIANLVTGALHNDDASGSDEVVLPDPVTPKAKAVRKSRAKKTPAKSEVEVDGDAEGASPATGSATELSTGKKRGAENDDDTPTKKPKITKSKTVKEPKTPKALKEPKVAKGTPKEKGAATGFPTCLADFDEGDRLIFDMKNQKHNWASIEEAWTKATGKIAGKDVLRKRHAKLVIVSQEVKAGDAVKIAEAKKFIDEEIAASIKKLNLERWNKVAARMVENGADSYKAGTLEKKWDSMVKTSEVDGEGKYIGTDVAAPEDGSEDTDEAVENGNESTASGEANININTGIEEGDVDENEDA